MGARQGRGSCLAWSEMQENIHGSLDTTVDTAARRSTRTNSSHQSRAIDSLFGNASLRIRSTFRINSPARKRPSSRPPCLGDHEVPPLPLQRIVSAREGEPENSLESVDFFLARQPLFNLLLPDTPFFLLPDCDDKRIRMRGVRRNV